jgi:uncharacterized protein (DUF58 family)
MPEPSAAPPEAAGGSALGRFLKIEDLNSLKSYQFAPEALVEGYLAGRHRSNRRGQSVEFSDYREYSPGDDIRMIDWKVLGRTDRYYVRLFDTETDMLVYLFLDSSASMGFGRGVSKLDYASFFTAALAHLIIRQGDRVALTTFDAGIRRHIPAGCTGRHMTALMHALEGNRPGERTRVSEALVRSAGLLKRRGILVLVSDLLDDPAEVFAALNLYTHRGFEVILFHCLHPDEIELPAQGLFRFRDMETGDSLPADCAAVRRSYSAALDEYLRSVRSLARRQNAYYVLARTDTHYFSLFDRYLTRRGVL